MARLYIFPDERKHKERTRGEGPNEGHERGRDKANAWPCFGTHAPATATATGSGGGRSALRLAYIPCKDAPP